MNEKSTSDAPIKQGEATSAKTPPKIEFRDVHKAFGAKQVLRGISLKVEPGESLVIIGGSGTGKSVLLKTLLGLHEPDQGQIFIDGEDTTHLGPNDRNTLMHRFGMLFQGGALFDSLPVWENVVFGLIHGEGKPRNKETYNIAIRNLEAVGLGEDIAHLSPSELSGGMQKRVSLARAIATHPEVILFDEPTTGLDPIMADVINDLIIKCSKDLGATTLSITHDMASARKIADYIAMLYEGRIIWHGRKEDIDNSGNPFVDQFIHGCAEGPIKMRKWKK